MPSQDQMAAARAMVEKDKADAVDPAAKKPLRLGELIDKLSEFDPKVQVRFLTGRKAGTFHSWRGSYDMLSLDPSPSDKSANETVEDLLRQCRYADGSDFEGYKGGNFFMNRNTFVWADPWGECPGFAVTDVLVRDFGREVCLAVEKIDSGPAVAESLYGLTDQALIAKHGVEEAPVPSEIKFQDELTHLINKHSMENGSNTPDYILAQYLSDCLKTFNTALALRESWFGRD